MAAYYNEHDPYAAQWLRNLIYENLIAPGEVDERSIIDVRPADLAGFNQCHFFAGIGGWSRALRLAGWPDDQPVWTGSCPCQPFSLAGRRAAQADERHLWPHFYRLVAQCRPSVVFGEQVSAAIGHGWLDEVFDDLEAADYACGAVVMPASAVGAPHRRDRLWFVAHACCVGRQSGRKDDRGDEWPVAAAKGQGMLADTTSERGHRGASRCDHAGRIVATAERATDPGAVADAERARSLPGALAGICGGEEGGWARHEQSERRGSALADAGVAFGGIGQQQSAGQFPQSEFDPGTRVVPGALGHADITGSQIGAGLCTDARAQCETTVGTGGPGFWDDVEWISGHDGKARAVKPGIRLLAHGVSGRVAIQRPNQQAVAPLPDTQPDTHWYNRIGALKGLGNAIVPQAAAAFITSFIDVQDSYNS